MRKILFLSALFVIFGCLLTNVSAQSADVGIGKNLAGGDVTSVSADKIVLQTKDGSIEVVISDKTEFKRIPPESPSIKNAVASSLSEISAGDKILVTGLVAADKKSMPAKAIYLLTKSDIAQKQAKDLEKWRTRGITGKIKAIDPQTKAITVSVRQLMGTRDVVLTPKENATYMRYAQDSVSYNDAQKSDFAEIKVDDAIRAVGDRGADGATFAAEEILTGAFQTIGGTITAVNAEKNEITINNFQTKKDVTIVVGNNTLLKQFPAEMAQRLSQMQAGGGGLRPPNQQGGQPNAQGQNQGGQGGGMRGGGAGSLDDMLDRFPTIAVADLKVGDMIAVSSTKSANLDRVTAIKLLSGVEPFIKAAQTANANGGGRGRGQGGADAGFTIPGLDGFGGP